MSGMIIITFWKLSPKHGMIIPLAFLEQNPTEIRFFFL